MAFGDVIQTAEGTVTSGAVTVNFSAPVSGNLLIFSVARSATLAAGQTWGTPTGGWALLSSTPANTGNIGAAWYYKISDGTETTVTSTESTAPGNGRGVVVEYEGPFAGTPLDQSTEDETNLSTVVTSQSSGTTGTTAQADELATAFFAADSATNVDGTRTYSNSFTEVIFSNAVTSNVRAAAVIARRVLSATGTYSTTYGVTDTGDEMYGAIATFKKAAAGGGTSVTPTAATCIASTTAPTPILGSISYSPAAASAVASTTAPAVVLGSLAAIPVVAAIIAGVVNPVIQFGSTSVIPTIASVIARVTAPQVDDSTTEARRVFQWERLWMRRRGR